MCRRRRPSWNNWAKALPHSTTGSKQLRLMTTITPTSSPRTPRRKRWNWVSSPSWTNRPCQQFLRRRPRLTRQACQSIWWVSTQCRSEDLPATIRRRANRHIRALIWFHRPAMSSIWMVTMVSPMRRMRASAPTSPSHLRCLQTRRRASPPHCRWWSTKMWAKQANKSRRLNLSSLKHL